MHVKKSLKQRLAANEQTYGCWVTLAHPLIPEILAPAGFDWLTLDMEHSSLDLADLPGLILSIERHGMTPLVRVGENDPNLIKRVMDNGAHGVIVANVKTAEEARRAVGAVKYPPHGTRGVGLYRAQAYGKRFEEYLKWVEEESLVIVQIEHIDALKEIDAIFQTPGVDAFMIGPYDFSGSLNKPGQFDDAEVKAGIEKVLEAGRRNQLPAGFHSVPSDPAVAMERRKQGYPFLAFSLDSILLGDAAIAAMKKIRQSP